MITTSVFGRATDTLRTSSQGSEDSVTVSLSNWKYKSEWAEYGLACEKEKQILIEGISQERQAWINVDKDRAKDKKKINRRGVIAMGLGFVVVLEGLIIAILVL